MTSVCALCTVLTKSFCMITELSAQIVSVTSFFPSISQTNDLTISDAKAVLSSNDMENASSDELRTCLEEMQKDNERLRMALADAAAESEKQSKMVEELSEKEVSGTCTNQIPPVLL